MRRGTWRIVACGAIHLLGAGAIRADAGEIVLHDDKFRPYREYSSGRVKISSYPNLIGTELLARVDRETGAITTLVSLEIAYSGDSLRSYESARNDRAAPLRFDAVSRDRSCEKSVCVYDELFTVEIPEAELRRAPPGGYQLKVFARRGGDAAITIPRGTIDTLLAAVERPGP